MRRTSLFVALIAASLIPIVNFSQTPPQETSRAVEGGGVKVSGWTGQVDAKEAEAGMTLNSAKFAKEGNAFHVVTGPAITYWNPANKASGDYTVKATFTEPKYMNINDHPHPYGVMIGGNDLGTDKQSYLYCAAYGNGSFIVRGFGPAAFQVNGRRASTDPAVNKAAAKGDPVTQEIALSVKGDKVECAINGKVVGSYDKAAVVGEGKLKSTDGIYGVRFGHNTEVMVKDLKLSKP
ncbi:MAG TPA: hypothetical protein VL907_01090 [Pyrinomonadaceae bacterium]|nr:hypothetical protein [Pyrinomonadaceae bacterium]